MFEVYFGSLILLCFKLHVYWILV